MTFVLMEEKDLDLVCELEGQCFKNPWDHKQCLYELRENPFSQGILLKEEEQIVGYAFLWITFELAQLARIGIDPKLRQKGYGTILMKHLIEIAQRQGCDVFTLEVRESNQQARALYKSSGLIEINRSKQYYPDGEDAIVYSMGI